MFRKHRLIGKLALLLLCVVITTSFSSCDSCKKNDTRPISSDMKRWCPLTNGAYTFENDSAEVVSLSFNSTDEFVEYPVVDNYDCEYSYELVETIITNPLIPFTLRFSAQEADADVESPFQDTTISYSWGSAYLFTSGTLHPDDSTHQLLLNYQLDGKSYEAVEHLVLSAVNSQLSPKPRLDVYWAKHIGLIYFGYPATNQWWHRVF